MANEQFHQFDQLGNEENEGKYDQPKERMTEYFADNVPVQDAHGENAECNTRVAARSARCRR